MLGTQDFPLFLLAVITLTVLPGPDTLYIVARSVAQGRTAGVVSVLGIGTGLLVHVTAATLGLSAVLASSAPAFTLLKWLGAAYLVYLGLQMLLQKPEAPTPDMTPTAAPLWRIYRQGLLTNLFNPKVGLFFLSLLPQFVDPTATQRELALLFLGVVFVTIGTLWCIGLALLAARVSTTVRRTSTALILTRRITGVLFVGLGLRLAVERG